MTLGVLPLVYCFSIRFDLGFAFAVGGFGFFPYVNELFALLSCQSRAVKA